MDDKTIAKFWVDVDSSRGPFECWPWTLAITPTTGYGQVNRQALGGHRTTHSVAYEIAKGPVPLGQEIDHECHNRDISCLGGKECPHRRCCNPTHLVAKSRQANQLAAALPRQRAHKDTCPQGHDMAGDNLGLLERRSGPKQGKVERYCKECNRIKARAAKEAKRATKG